ncbi:MAG: lysophospholipid acyltransferase family protein [Thermoanaerobaculia bacterium]
MSGSRRKSRPQIWLEYALFRAVTAVFRRASTASLERWSARTAGMARRVLRKRDRIALRNLRLVFPDLPESEVRRIASECWRHYARSTFDFLRTIEVPPEAIADRFSFEGPRDEVFATLRDGSGIFVTAHLGSWEMAASILSRFDRDVRVVARPLDNPLIDQRLLRARTRTGITIVPRRRAARDLVRALDRGGLVIMVADQAVRPREGVLVPFLGRPAWTTTAPARLALRFGVPIWCVYAVPEGEGFRLRIDEPIRPEALPPEQRTVEAITARMNEQISARIRNAPALWLWMHDRWKGA